MSNTLTCLGLQVLIDAGMVDVMGANEQENFIGVFKAMGAGNGRAAASFLLKFSEKQEVRLMLFVLVSFIGIL